jgi:START domain-containing protein
MKRLLQTLFLCGVALLALGLSVRAQDWTLVGNDHGIEIYRREIPGSGVVALRGVGTIDAPLWKIASILLDTRRAPEWVDSLKESRVLRRLGLNGYVEYNHIAGPLVMKDRDFVSDVAIEVDPRAKTFALIYKPSDDPGVPASRHVRGEILSGVFRATSLDNARTDLTAELHCDPKGALPKWIVNLFQKNWPRNTLEAIRTQAAKPDIVMPDQFKDVLAPTRQF